MTTDSKDTRELIAEAEALRGEKKGELPKTRQLVREAEGLIGRDVGSQRRSGLLILLAGIAILGAVVLAGLLLR